jgi:hypothetical protein
VSYGRLLVTGDAKAPLRAPPGDLPWHAEAECEVRAEPSAIFDYIDRPERLSAHMARRSWQMAGAISP